MSYQVLARKWRPHSFEQMVGQGHVLRALINALDSDRLHHAYLFTGTRGVGKTSLARVFAKALNCETGVSSTPCGTCSSCIEVDEGRCVDLIEVDAASRTKVDETRDLLDNVQYAPTRGRYKVYLIDEVHMFSAHSFNALLKTLEEPPPHVKFLLATTDPKKLPVTILSRCLQFNLKRVTVEQLIEHLRKIVDAESVVADSPSLALIADAADGSVRDSLSLLDQAIAFGGGELKQDEVATMLGTIGAADIVSLLERLAENNGDGLITRARELAEAAPDYHHVLGEMLSFLRRIAVYQQLDQAADELEDDADVIALAEQLSPEDCQLFYQIGLIGRRDLALAPDPQSGFEMVLLRMLAFRPLEAGEGAKSHGAARERSRPVSEKSDNRDALAAPDSAKSKSVATAVDVVEPPSPSAMTDVTPSVEGPSDVNETDPSNSETAVAESGSENVDRVAPGSAVDWNAIVARLELHGLARELARNTVVGTMSEKFVDLIVAPQHENLKAGGAVASLEAALKKQLKLDVRIRLSVAGERDLDTPSKRHSEAELERQRAAENNIGEDPVVRSLQDEFGATIEQVRPK